MSQWKTRLFALLIIVLVFGVGYSYIVAQGTKDRDQSLQKETATMTTSLGKLQFEIKDNDAVALNRSMFTLQQLSGLGTDTDSDANLDTSTDNTADSDLDATVSGWDQLMTGNLLSAHTKVTVNLHMLTMDCGTIQFTMTPDERGIYHGEGIPVMPGLWMATATITYEDQPLDEAIKLAFTFDVK